MHHLDAPEPSPLADLGLSARAVNALHRSGVTTVQQLRALTADDLRDMRGIGSKIQTEILDALSALLGTTSDPTATGTVQATTGRDHAVTSLDARVPGVSYHWWRTRPGRPKKTASRAAYAAASDVTLRQIRGQRGLNISDLADLIAPHLGHRPSDPTLSRYERGARAWTRREPNGPLMEAWMTALGIPPGHLVWLPKAGPRLEHDTPKAPDATEGSRHRQGRRTRGTARPAT